MANGEKTSKDDQQKSDKRDCWVGFDLGGTKMMAVVYDSDFKPLGRKRRKTRDKGKDGVHPDRIIETIRMAIEDAGIDESDVKGIGAGCPGPLDLKEGVILQAPNLGWENVKLKKLSLIHI